MPSSASPLTNRPQAKQGRPPLDPGLGVMVRVREPLCSLLDQWRGQQIERPSRPEAIRRLTALALTAAGEKEL